MSKKKKEKKDSLQSQGGKALLKQRGPDYFSRLSKRGWKMRRAEKRKKEQE